MNPLRPSPRLLRRIARQFGATTDRYIGPWLIAVRALPPIPRTKKFLHTSVVETFRGPRRKLCGYEVWRHLDTSGNDPTRRKARLWFGCRKHGSRRRARQMAYYAAATLAKMSPHELREWWSEYQGARTTHRPVGSLWRDERRYTDTLDYTDRQLMNHSFAEAS